MNKILIIIFSIIIFFNSYLPLIPQSKLSQDEISMPSAEEIEKIMETDEFKEMMNELEKIFGDTGKEDFNKPDKQTPSKPEIKINKKQNISEVKKSKKQHFEEPAQNNDDKNKIIKKLPQKKIEAFYFYINQFTSLLNKLQRKMNSYELGIIFKEEVEDSGLNNILNEINISISQIKSKKLYMRAFFLPMFTELRKKIISVIPKLKKIKNKINKYSINKNEEILNIEYLKKISQKLNTKEDIKNNKTSKQIYLELNPIQEEISNLLNNDLKKIEKQITMIAVNSTVKEIITKKIDIRKQQEKNAIKKTGYNRYSRSYGGRYGKQRSYRSTPNYSYSRPRYSGWSGNSSNSPSVNRTGGWYNDYYNKQRLPKKSDNLNTTKKNNSKLDNKNKPSYQKVQTDKEPKDAEIVINKIKNLTNETILLLKKLMSKYKLEDNAHKLKQIYNLKLLSKINANLNKLNEEKQSISAEKIKDIKELNSLKTELRYFIPYGVRLAKNFGPIEEIDSAFSILSKVESNDISENLVESEFSKYENKLIEQIDEKQKKLSSFKSNTNDLKLILNNIKILEIQPKVNFEKIEKTKENVRREVKLILEPWNNIAENSLEQIHELKNGIGKNQLGLYTIRGEVENILEDQSLKTKNEIKDIIDETTFPEEFQEILNKPLEEIEGDDDTELTIDQQNKFKQNLSDIAIKLKKDAKLFAEIMKITEPESKDEELDEPVRNVEREGILGKTITFIKGLFAPGQE